MGGARAIRRVLLVALVLVLVALVVALVVTYAPLPPPSPTPTASTSPVARVLSARIVVSLPHGGARRAQTEGIANAVRLAVEDTNGRVNTGDASVTLEVDILDSAGPDGAWSEVVERANADRAASDRSVIAYVGPGTLDAAKVVAPVAASAGLLVVTPTLTHPALTTRGYDDALFDALHPGGAAVFIRTIPSDEAAARATLRWAADRSLTPVAADRDDTWSMAFADAAAARGLRPTSPSPVDAFVYLGGAPADAAGQRARELKRQRANVVMGGAEGILSDAFLRAAGGAAEGAVATFAGRPLERYSGPSGVFARGYRDRFLIDPDPYAIFGYEAARLALDALRRSRQGAILDRGAVRDAAFATKDLEGALGTWSVDARGASSYATLQLYTVKALPSGSFAWVWDSEITP